MINAAGCALNEPKQVNLYDNYLRLEEAAKKSDTVNQVSRYFTSHYLKEVDLNDENSLLLLKLSNYMEKAILHYQKMDHDSGCLTVNGYERNGDPLALYIEYKKENDLWLVNYMYLNFLETQEDFINRAICPNGAEQVNTHQ